MAAGVALFGYGHWGRNLARNFAALGALKAISDPNSAALDQARRAYPDVRLSGDWGDFIDDPAIDACVVATPAALHFDVARRALEAGKDVFVEKPLALTVKEGEALVEVAAQQRRILMVGHLLEYHPAIERLRTLVSGGELGKVQYVYSTRLNLGRIRTEENALWSFAPHDLSVILHLVDQEPVDVVARGSAFLQPEVEDVVFVDLRFPSGQTAHVHVSWLDPHKLRKFTVVGSQKMMVFDDMEPSEKIKVYDKGVDVRVGQVVSYGDALTVRSGDILIPKISLQEPLKLECQHFVECVRERKRPLSDGIGGLRVVKVLDAAQRSLKSGGQPVSIQPLPQEVA
jgi:predicted dehydrogenase